MKVVVFFIFGFFFPPVPPEVITLSSTEVHATGQGFQPRKKKNVYSTRYKISRICIREREEANVKYAAHPTIVRYAVGDLVAGRSNPPGGWYHPSRVGNDALVAPPPRVRGPDRTPHVTSPGWYPTPAKKIKKYFPTRRWITQPSDTREKGGTPNLVRCERKKETTVCRASALTSWKP